MVRKLPKAVIGRDAIEANAGTHEDDILLSFTPDNRRTLLQSQIQSALFNSMRNPRSTDLARYDAQTKAIQLDKEGLVTVARVYSGDAIVQRNPEFPAERSDAGQYKEATEELKVSCRAIEDLTYCVECGRQYEATVGKEGDRTEPKSFCCAK